jgi:acetate kinase
VATLEIPSILAINGGSSSIRFALYGQSPAAPMLLHGHVDRAAAATTLRVVDPVDARRYPHPIDVGADVDPGEWLIDWLDGESWLTHVVAAGHRIVHGMQHARPTPITSALLAELRRYVAFAPEHLPPALRIVDALRAHCPSLPQIACFDTAFHHDMPRVAQIVPIPRRFEALGVRRYGFHGLSCEYLIDALAQRAGASAAHGRVILAHLGHGASITAVGGGRSIDTSMGFTPSAGVPMSTRSGDVDPGLVAYLANVDAMTAAQFSAMATHQAGLLGISQTSGDMRELLANEAADPRAAEAIAVFCHHVRKSIGAMAAVLAGLDALVFSGGIGENAPVIRARICAGLEHLGVVLSPSANERGAPVISTATSRAAVHVIATDEQRVIAKAVLQSLGPDHAPP